MAKIKGWDGTNPSVEELKKASADLIHQALTSGDSKMLADVKILMDAHCATRSALMDLIKKDEPLKSPSSSRGPFPGTPYGD